MVESVQQLRILKVSKKSKDLLKSNWVPIKLITTKKLLIFCGVILTKAKI